MSLLSTLPPLEQLLGQVVIVEAPPGHERRQALATLVAEAGKDEFARLLVCDFAGHGPWAGLAELLGELLPEMEKEMADMVTQHHQELGLILPETRARLWRSHNPATLTDRVPLNERVRSYPIDRAYRLVHGAIDLLRSYSARRGGQPWLLIFDDFQGGGALVKRFVREVARRGLGSTRLTLVIGVDPDAGVEEARAFAEMPRILQLDLGATDTVLPDPDQMEADALALEALTQERPQEAELHLAQLIYRWSHSRQSERALKWRSLALSIYNHYGFYEDALRLAAPIVDDIDRAVMASEGIFRRWDIVSGIFNALVAVGRPEDAHVLVLEQANNPETPANDLMGIYYSLAMLNARFMRNPDFELAEGYLERALEETRNATVSETDKHFLSVFILNGLAFIRYRQGRHEEAVRLCNDGYEHLKRHLGADEHRLHRSVLLYNIAQVNSANRSYEDAVRNYSVAIEMDPNYSEYYNERGSVFLKMGRLAEALADYRRAIETSPPYSEVWANLGQAYRLLGQWPEAKAAYERAIELVPGQALALVGLAQVLDALGDSTGALARYTAALAEDPNQPLVLANRAALFYEQGKYPESLADLDQALLLAPDNADLYLNRAVVAAELGMDERARQDLASCLKLTNDTATRADAEERMRELTRPNAG